MAIKLISNSVNKFEIEKQIGSLTLLDFKAFYKATKIETSLQ